MEEIEDLILSDVVEERKEVPIEERKKETRTHKSASKHQEIRESKAGVEILFTSFLAEDDGN